MKTAHDLVMQAKATVHEIPIDQASQAIQQADVLLDVREADEFAAGHLPGAIHTSRGLLEFKLSSPDLSSRDLRALLQNQWPRRVGGQGHARDGLPSCRLYCGRF
jgi:3-mercaptopyruvate sulfurtransferase SseA